MAENPVGGIDLGTSNSCIGLWKDGKVNVLTNKYGQTTTPSCVGFTESGVLIGNSAIKQQIDNPENTIYEAKRAIGRSAKLVEKEFKFMPFTMTQDTHPKFNVQMEDGSKKLISPEEIAAIILKELKDVAQAHSSNGQEVKDK